MFISISTDYFCAKRIDASTNIKTRKIFLLLSIIVNLSILIYFKYFNFFADNLESLLHFFNLSTNHFLPFKIILPLGISFYTFEAISYTVDVYRKTSKPASTYSDYLLFVIYFPHLIAGPIMRAKSFLPQISLPRKITMESFYQGSYLFFWGLFEKMYVADNLAKIINPIFAQTSYEGQYVLLALYGFAFQIFCDFDGYSNMARGLGKCMGFDITINFKLPYFATNPREFWQRWHISLSTWLRDYLYIPLGGNQFGRVRMYAALLITMLLGGLWHGASWTFILWGAYHGIILIVYRIFEDKTRSNQEIRHPILKLINIVFFFHLIILGWLLFRAQSIEQVLNMLHALFFNFNFKLIDLSLWSQLISFILPLLLIQIWQYKSKDLDVIYKQHWLIKTAIYAFLTFLTLGWGVMKAEEFIYFQF